jgi:hypothetical protein
MVSRFIPTKLLYIGAWDHIDPVFHFAKTKEFVFVDTQPRSEFDREKIFETCFYRKKFYKRIIDTYYKAGFRLFSTTILDKEYYKKLKVHTEYGDNESISTYKHINPTLLHFVNPITDQTIKYYISTNIKYNMSNLLQDDIKQTDGLLLSGYFPNKILLDYLPETNKTFYCYNQTCYDKEDNCETILQSLYEDGEDFKDKEIDFIVMDKESGKELHRCVRIQDVETFLHL